jgi:hypothetical protein
VLQEKFYNSENICFFWLKSFICNSLLLKLSVLIQICFRILIFIWIRSRIRIRIQIQIRIRIQIHIIIWIRIQQKVSDSCGFEFWFGSAILLIKLHKTWASVIFFFKTCLDYEPNITFYSFLWVSNLIAIGSKKTRSNDFRVSCRKKTFFSDMKLDKKPK